MEYSGVRKSQEEDRCLRLERLPRLGGIGPMNEQFLLNVLTRIYVKNEERGLLVSLSINNILLII